MPNRIRCTAGVAPGVHVVFVCAGSAHTDSFCGLFDTVNFLLAMNNTVPVLSTVIVRIQGGKS